jgi:hypothetical protein
MDFKFHDSKGSIKRFCGVELEISDIKNHDKVYEVVNKWGGQIGEDGSIDGENTAEIRTAPARGKLFIQQIKEICGVLNEVGAEVNESCGLHVHVDARDFTSEDLFKVALLWEKYEPTMFRKVAKHRRNNSYCAKMGNVLSSIVKTQNELPMNKIDRFREEFNDLDKNCSLNFNPILEFGTIENRMLEGCIDADKIIKWAEINSKMIDFCKKVKFDKIENIKVISSRAFSLRP